MTYYTAFNHLKAGTITAREKRLLLSMRVIRHGLIAAATVSG